MQTNYAHVGEKSQSITRSLGPGELEAMSTSELFHRLWTRAVGQPGYDKAQWRSFRRAPTRNALVELKEVAKGQADYSEDEWMEFFRRGLIGVSL